MQIYKLSTHRWYLERIIFLIAGLFVVVFAALAYFVSPYFGLPIVLVGLMQIIFAITGYCPMAILLNSFGIQEK